MNNLLFLTIKKKIMEYDYLFYIILSLTIYLGIIYTCYRYGYLDKYIRRDNTQIIETTINPVVCTTPQ